ncbi:MAG TPA: hypothetical protein VNW90_20500 [Acetobacteraceae bacterium]|jgi:hypothetical protein|nr:hypothetical protein [Acetobacteraceae bacterium]
MIELIGIELGSRLHIVGGITAEVVEIVNDEWVRVRLVDVPEGAATVGTEELCHATDIIEIA